MAGISFSGTPGLWNGENGGGRVLLYDASGNPIYKTNLSTYDGQTTVGVPMMMQDGDLVRIPRSTQDGSVQTSHPMICFFDAVEGVTVNVDRWISTVTTMTITQTAGLGTLFNAGGSSAAGVGAMLVSKAVMPIIPIGGCLRYRSRIQMSQHFVDNVTEIGFGFPASATAVGIVDGAVIRKNASGQWAGCVTFNTADVDGTTIVDNATFIAAIPIGTYFEVEVQVFIDRTVFWIRAPDGTIVLYDRVDYPGTIGTWGTTHLRVLHRTYNSAATGTAVTMRVAGTTVDLLDRSGHNLPWGDQMTGQFLDGMTSPLAFTQSANWTNSVAGTTRTLANATAGEATLGGILVANSMAGAVTDLLMFGYVVPTGYNFNLTGIRIGPPLNGVVAVATTPTVFQYFFATNSTAVSLATASAMRRALPGFHSAAVGLAAGGVFDGKTIEVRFTNAIRIASARYLQIGVRCPVGTATATETYTWTVGVDGYFS